MTKARLYAIEKCVDRDIRRIFAMIQKYKKITIFVEHLYTMDKSLALKFVITLPNNLLRIYTQEKENTKIHR